MFRLAGIIITILFITTTQAQNVGIGVLVPAAKLDIAGNIKITDGSQGSGKVLTSDVNGLANWTIPNNSYLSYNYVQVNGAGIESSSTIFIRVGTFIYRGSLIENIFQIFALMYTTNISAFYKIRLQDVTNNITIGTSGFSNTGTLALPEIVSFLTLTNLPVNAAVFEIQIQTNSAIGKAGLLSFQVFK
ncbi:MAG: hypothetical protein ABIW38_02885 [Ferruginibacter sp.]